MARIYTRTETLAAVGPLTETRLVSLIEARVITPAADAGSTSERYAETDLSRLALCCELLDTFDLEADALGMVMDLIDEMHGLRGDLRALTAALHEEPDETVQRVVARVQVLR